MMLHSYYLIDKMDELTNKLLTLNMLLSVSHIDLLINVVEFVLNFTLKLIVFDKIYHFVKALPLSLEFMMSALTDLPIMMLNPVLSALSVTLTFEPLYK